MKSWIYEKRLEENVACRLQRYKKRLEGPNNINRRAWYESGFFDGWCAAIAELSKPRKPK